MRLTEDGNRDDRTVRFGYCLILVLFVAASLSAVMQSRPLQSANDRSRWSTVYSLVERGTYAIDEIDADPAWYTIDKVRHEGHFYSSKPPLFPTAVAGLYWVQRHTQGLNLYKHPLEVTRGLLVVVNVVPFLISLLLLIRIVERHVQSPQARIFIVAIAAFATMLTTFQTTLNNHSVGASCLFFSLYCASRVLCDGERKAIWFAGTGFFAALTCTVELPAALFGVCIFLVMARNDVRKTTVSFVPAALVPLAAFFITNWIATGGWKPFYMYYGTEKYLYTVDGIPSYWFTPQGLDRNQESTLTYLMHCVVGHHGVLSLTPLFALSIVGSLSAIRNKANALRPIIVLGALLSVCVLGFYLSRTQNYNYGGNSAALRWMLWLIPFWLFAIMPVVDRYWNARWFRGVAFVLFAVSIYSVGTSIGKPWGHPWLYTVMQNAGVIDYKVAPEPLDRPRKTWIGSLPKQQTAWVEFSAASVSSASAGSRIRLTWDDGDTGDQIGVLTIDQPGQESQNLTILKPEFDRGDSAWKFIREPSIELARFLTGMPRSREYQPGVIRYVRTPVRKDAFRCQRAASRVNLVENVGESSSPFQQGQIHRCDVWLTPELPFGVAQVEFTVTNAADFAIVRRERWIATACSEIIPVDDVQSTP